ncbi:MAG: 23S rRNA (uracil(1939)-C(5))-methyltransferase RlmD [Ruthenibacterium lactatiformans]
MQKLRLWHRRKRPHARHRAHPADCPIFGRCGGCCFRHFPTKQSLRQSKASWRTPCAASAAGCARAGHPSLSTDRALPEQGAVSSVSRWGRQCSSRLYASRSHRPLPCGDCLLQPGLLNRIAATLCALLTQYHISVYDEQAHRGLARHIYLRHAVTNGSVLVCLVCNGRSLPHAQDICAALVKAHPEVESVVLNVNTHKTNVITGKECITLYGPGVLHDTMRGVPVALGPLSFYQVNTEGANRLYSVAADFAAPGPEDTLLDLYCGAGTIGLSMAEHCGRLIGVEIVPEAVESARRNAAAMGVEHAEFFCADAGTAAQKLAADGLLPNIVVLDPPRKGCDEPTLKAVLAMAPQRIVMVSCNPATAARDLKYLSQHGYAVQAVQPVDMFPRTKHVECAALLCREKF